MEYSNKEPSAQDIMNYMVALGSRKYDSKIQQKNTLSQDILLPSVGVERCKAITTIVNVYVNMSNGQQHVMQCIYGINDTLSKSVFTVMPIGFAWN